MGIVFLLVGIILSPYTFVLLIPAFVFVFRKDKRRKLFIPKTFISIIVPVRNEEQNISDCLKSILETDYPKNLFEIIVVDDHSTDKTKLIADKFLKSNNNISILANNGVGKKSALTLGVKNAKAELIVTTDGDCIVPKNWLNRFAEIHENDNPVFIAGPVAYKKSGGVFRDLLQIEQIVLQTISGGTMLMNAATMCSGANLGYTKKFFLESGGYENDKFTSGDDMLLLLKAKKMFPQKIKFIKSKDAIVKTNSAKSLNEAIQQRSRWLSKFSAYKSFSISITGIIVMLANILFLVSGIAICFDKNLFLPVILAMGGKTIVDLLLLSLAVPFFREPRLLLLGILGEIFYPILAISSIVARFSKTFTWKDRKWKT